MHGGYGIYYDRIVFEVMSLEKGFDGRRTGAERHSWQRHHRSDGNPVYLNLNGTFLPGAPELVSSPFSGFLLAGAGSTGIDVINNRLRDPMVQQINLGIEQQIGRASSSKSTACTTLARASSSVDPVGSVFNPADRRPGQVTDLESAVETRNTTLSGSARSSVLRKYGEFDAAYTLSKAYNYANDDQIPFEYSPIDPNNLQLEYGPPPNDQRHRLV